MSGPLQCDIVVYHYIHPPEPQALPRYHGRTLDEFVQQLDQLEESYRIVSLTEYLQLLGGSRAPDRADDRRLCVLSFDDGLRPHAEVVAPVLADRGLSGAFFLITGALDDGMVAGVHMLHLLLAEYGTDELVLRLVAVADELDPGFTPRFELFCQELTGGDPSGRYFFDTPRTVALKKLLNYEFSEERRDTLLRPVFLDTFGLEQEVSRGLYLNWDQARKMAEVGMCVGGHTHGHAMLTRMTAPALERDLARCRSALEANLGSGPFPFTYPFGNEVAVDERVAQATEHAGFTCGLTVLTGTNGEGADPYWLRRLDTIGIG